MINGENSSNNFVSGTATNVYVNVTTNKVQVTAGEEVTFTLQYYAEDGPGSIKPGETIIFQLPSIFSGIQINYPKQHFESVKVNGTTVTAIFGIGAETALGGYMTISAIPKAVDKETNEQISYSIDGQVKYLNIDVEPAPKPAPVVPIGDGVKFLKTFGNEIVPPGITPVQTVTEPVINKGFSYSIFVNGDYENLDNVVINDHLPEGMEITPNSVVVFETIKGQEQQNVTDTLSKSGSIIQTSTSLKISLGNINAKYIIRYEALIDKEEPSYINTATLTDNNGTLTSSARVDVTKYNGPAITKGHNQSSVSNLGEYIEYFINVNPNGAKMQDVVVTDVFPSEMTYLAGTVNIAEYNSYGQVIWISSNGILTVGDHELTFNFGDISNHYEIMYDMDINGPSLDYVNQVTITHDKESYTTSDTISFQANSGAINAYKTVTPETLTNTSSQIVKYSIDFQSYGYFDENYITATEEINKDVKILFVQAPDNFTYTINNNVVTFSNSAGKILYGQKFNVTIVTDFSGVPDGTTIDNTAKINKSISNTVQTKKGYAFTATKVDSTNPNYYIEGAIFNLLDSNNKVITQLTSNSSGIITSAINSPGIYYLQEVTAPKGYVLENNKVQITITANDIGETINIGNVENQSIDYPIDIKKVDKNNPNKALSGAEYQVYNTDSTPNKLITTVITGENGEAQIMLPEGKYKLVEIKPPTGYVESSSNDSFELTYGNEK